MLDLNPKLTPTWVIFWKIGKIFCIIFYAPVFSKINLASDNDRGVARGFPKSTNPSTSSTSSENISNL